MNSKMGIVCFIPENDHFIARNKTHLLALNVNEASTSGLKQGDTIWQ